MITMKTRMRDYMVMNLMQEFCIQYSTIYRKSWLLSNFHVFWRLLRYEWFTPHSTQISLKIDKIILSYMFYKNKLKVNFNIYVLYAHVYTHILQRMLDSSLKLKLCCEVFIYRMHIQKYRSTFKYAIVSNGKRVKGTRYNKAGCAALNTSELTVAVSKPRK